MKYYIVVVRDRAADVFGVPSFVASKGAAIRGFGDECQREDKGNLFYQHPEDFDLYELGEYDDSNGTFIQLERPKQIAVGKDFRQTN